MARPPRGTTEQAFERALTAARREDLLGPLDVALVAAGRASARLVDTATTEGTVWMVEAAIRRHVETLRELRLTPGSRPDNHDDDPFLKALGTLMGREDQRAADYRAHQAEPTE